MTYEKAAEQLKSMEGCMIDVRMRAPKAKQGSGSLVGFAGRVREVKPSGIRNGWVAALEVDGEPKPMQPNHVMLDRRTFENAWMTYDHGAAETLSVRHAGIVMDVTAWV